MCIPYIFDSCTITYDSFSTAANARQPNLLQWNKHIEDCLYNLENAEDSLPSDATLVQWVRLRRLVDEIFACFKMEDLGITTKLNHENEGLINHYDRELSKWREQMSKGSSCRKYITACIKKPLIVLLNYVQNL